MKREEMIADVVEMCRMLCLSPEEVWNSHVAEEMKKEFGKEEIIGGAETALGAAAPRTL